MTPRTPSSGQSPGTRCAPAGAAAKTRRHPDGGRRRPRRGRGHRLWPGQPAGERAQGIGTDDVERTGPLEQAPFRVGVVDGDSGHGCRHDPIVDGRAPTTSTTPTAAGSTHGPITSPPLPAPGAGFNEGQVTAVGDSVMLDYQAPLQQDIPGANVQAAVSEQWSAGEAELAQLKSGGQLGAVVIVGLSTNGPITSTDFANMMSILSGASRVVFVTIHVDRPWQDSNNAVLAAGVRQYPNTVLADWYGLVEQNPGWLYSDGTHLPIDGPGAQALANLVAAQA